MIVSKINDFDMVVVDKEIASSFLASTKAAEMLLGLMYKDSSVVHIPFMEMALKMTLPLLAQQEIRRFFYFKQHKYYHLFIVQPLCW